MKTPLFLCLPLVFAGIASVSAQAPAAPHMHSLSLSAELASGGSTVHDAENASSKVGRLNQYAGSLADKTKESESQTTKESETIQINVRNLAPLPDTAQVEWYFVAAPVKPDPRTPFLQQESIFDQGAQSITVAPGATVNIPAQSKDLVSKLNRHVNGHMQKGKPKRDANWEKDQGSVMKGWMVRLVADGKLIDSRASSDELSDIAKDDAKFSSFKGH